MAKKHGKSLASTKLTVAMFTETWQYQVKSAHRYLLRKYYKSYATQNK